MNKIKKVLSEVLFEISPSKEELKEMNGIVNDFLRDISQRIRKERINVQAFVGGSFAKGTVTKKDSYDADIFLRFDKKYSEKEYGDYIRKILKGKKFETVHGSRDYFKIKVKDNFFIEIIPVKKISKPSEAENITDLSYSHVKYLKKAIKNKLILEEIKLAKAFCFANKVYGAESYIQGFSGYSLELLVNYYGGFEKMLKKLVKVKEEKLIIDIEKFYPRKKNVLLDINESKLESPIILVDPTYKTRNVLAALSDESFRKFQEAARKFLKNPSKKDFELEKIDVEKVKKRALSSGKDFIEAEIATSKEPGDVAGTKLLKFYRHFVEEVSKYFIISNKGFNYNQKQSARFFIVAVPKKEIIFEGPFVSDKKNSERFMKEHSNITEKNRKLFAKEKIDFSLKEFFEKWKTKNKKKVREMYLTGLRMI